MTARGGQLIEIFGTVPFEVNSIHRQGIRTLGDDLVATVYTDDGLIEGFEEEDKNILAVQWHPEELVAHPEQRRLLQHFADRLATI